MLKILFAHSCSVRPGQLGIIYNRIGGINETALCKEGMNFIIPWFQRPIIYDVRTRPQLINTQTGSKDLQMIQISLRVLYRPNQNHLPFIYRRLGKGIPISFSRGFSTFI
jgi:regulator of protease activity HflC (stomatin/prohibitin superfamily)